MYKLRTQNMKKTILSVLAASFCTALSAQTNITPEVLKQLEGSYTGTPTEKAVRNAISHVGIQQMAVNSENVGLKDKKFNVEVKNTGISNQKNSGRCWLFTGLNVLRGRAMKKLTLVC